MKKIYESPIFTLLMFDEFDVNTDVISSSDNGTYEDGENDYVTDNNWWE